MAAYLGIRCFELHRSLESLGIQPYSHVVCEQLSAAELSEQYNNFSICNAPACPLQLLAGFQAPTAVAQRAAAAASVLAASRA